MNEQQIREALHGVADAPGRPDEHAAWQQIRAGIERDRGRSRLRTALTVTGLAVAGAAAAGVIVVAGGGDDREAVQIGPADSTTTVQSLPSADGFPERPLAVVVEIDGAQRLDLYDAETGELVTAGLAGSVHSLSDVSIATNGIIYFTEELGDSSVVRAVPWDGSSEPFTPFGAEETDSSGPTLSADGRTFAYIRQGITTPQPSIQLIDTETGERRVVDSQPDVRISNLEFSLGGDRLLVLLDGEPAFLDVDTALSPFVDAASLTRLADVATVEAHWESSGGIIASLLCCEPDFAGPFDLMDITIDGPGSLRLPDVDGLVAFEVDRRGTFAVVRDDGGLLLVDRSGDTRAIPVEGSAVDVGF
jgi:hypothetical protein